MVCSLVHPVVRRAAVSAAAEPVFGQDDDGDFVYPFRDPDA